MTVSVTAAALADLDADLLILPAAEDRAAEALAAWADAFGPALERAADDFGGTADEALLVYPDRGSARRVVLVGLGEDAGAEGLRRAAAKGAEHAAAREAASVALALPETPLPASEAAQALVEGFVLASYRFRRYKTDEAFGGPDSLRLVVEEAGEEATAGAERGRIVAEATCTARDLVNRSPDEKTAPLFAEAIQASGAEHGYGVEVWDKARIEEEGMGGLLAVSRGSEAPPTFSILTWDPEDAVNERPIVLVGKGVVFDTGGLSLKPTKGSMDMMKADMGGAAAVVGAFEALADLGLPLRVVGLVPATDNRPGKSAYVPGDVVRMHSGATVEVLNTDAEGRMLLADALSYARTLDPDLVIDLATLTGAAVVALGHEAAAVMTSETGGGDERLAAVEAAGRASGERACRLPMFGEYADLLKSDVADLKNVGGRPAGSVTAGKFLEHFTRTDDGAPAYPWIHLDIAGTAFLQEAKPYRPKGGTGFGVRLLAAFLRRRAAARVGG